MAPTRTCKAVLLEMEWLDKAISDERIAVSGDSPADVERRLVFNLEPNGTRVSVTQTGVANAESADWARGAWDRAGAFDDDSLVSCR